MTGKPSVAKFERAFETARLQLHHGVVGSAVAAGAVLGAVTAAVLWPRGEHRLLLIWLAALATSLALRAAVRRAHHRAGSNTTAPWLWRYRATYALHGLAWALLPLLLGAKAPHGGLDVLVLASTVMVGGALVAAAFDGVAGLLFGVPALLPTLALLLARGDGDARAQALMVLCFVAVSALAALRMRRAIRTTVSAQLLEAERAAEAEAARAALARQHELLSQLVRTTRQGYWYVDAAGLTTDVNAAMCSMLGRPREQVLGHHVTEFFEDDALHQVQREIENRRQGQASGYEIELRRPDGSKLICHNNATPIQDARGLHIGSVGLWTDLSSHAEVERELRTYAKVTNSLTDAVSVVDDHGVYRLVNDAWCQSTGIAREQALGRTVDEVLPTSATPERRAAVRDCLASNEIHVVRGSVALPSLAGRIVETTYYPYRSDDDGARRVVLVSRDITERQASRVALETSAEYLRRTLNATSDAIFASDAGNPNEPVRFVNAQMLQMFGIPPELASTLTPSQIMQHAMPLFRDPQGQARRVREVIDNNLADDSRVELRDGRVLWRRCVQAPMAEGRLRVWSFRDITAEEQALQAMRTSDAELRAVLAAFPGFIAAVDREYRYTYANERLSLLFGRPAHEVIGLQIREVIGEERFQLNRAEIERARSGVRTVAERHYPANAQRGRIDLEMTHVIGPVQPDGRQTSYAYGQDITARKQAEEALIAARDEAERANRAKSQFLSQMSHELRTPMNAVLGFAQLLQDDPRGSLAPHQQGWVREISAAANHLLALINEVLDLGRVEAGTLALQASPVATHEVVAECLALVQPLAQAGGVILLPTTGLPDCGPVLADRTRLKQVLLNLLGNAIKYNRRDGQVQVGATLEGASVLLSVRDTGLGLSAEEQTRLFQPFERIGAENSGIEGTGIGLALSRRLVHAMGGQIGVRSSAGVGSSFWVRLPAATGEVAAPPPQLLAGSGLPDLPAGATALYVDDNPVNVALMEAMLQRLEGLRLLSASLPLEGLQTAQRELPGLILLDIQMPGMDGYELLQRLRSDRRTRAIPVVAVSASAQQTDIDRARAAGFDGYLAKPLDLPLLLGTVRRMLQPPAQPGPPGAPKPR